MKPSKAHAHIREIDGWTLLEIRPSEGFPGRTLRYARPEFDDVALVFVPEGDPIEKRKVAANLQKLFDRGPPSAHA